MAASDRNDDVDPAAIAEDLLLRLRRGERWGQWGGEDESNPQSVGARRAQALSSAFQVYLRDGFPPASSNLVRPAEAPGATLPLNLTPPHNEPMDAVPRPELDAKLEAIEARMDGRVAGIEAKIDSLLTKMDARDQVLSTRIDSLQEQMRGTREEVTAGRQEARSFRVQFFLALVATAVAVVFGIVGFNSSLLNNMVAYGESQRNLGTAAGGFTEQLQQARKDIENLQKPTVSTPAGSTASSPKK